jgi:hypothetical protein
MGAGGEGESRADGHHLGMHRQRGIGVMAAAHGLERRERTLALLILQLRLVLRLRLRFQALLQLSNGWTIKRTGWENAGLESPTIKARTVAVETLADDLPTANNDRAMAVVERRQLGLSEAEGEVSIVASRHFELGCDL